MFTGIVRLGVNNMFPATTLALARRTLIPILLVVATESIFPPQCRATGNITPTVSTVIAKIQADQFPDGSWGLICPVDAKSSVRIYDTLTRFGRMERLEQSKARCYLEETLQGWWRRPIPRWRDTDVDDMPPAELIDYYYEYTHALLALINVSDHDTDELRMYVTRLLDQQDADGSWGGLTLALYTAHIVRMLNQYYALTANTTVLRAIVKANDWQLRQIEMAIEEARPPVLFVLCSYYAISLTNMPDVILLRPDAHTMLDLLRRQYYLRATTHLVANGPIDYLDEVTGWLVYTLIVDRGQMVTDEEKQTLCANVVESIVERQRPNGGWGQNQWARNDVTCMALRLLSAAMDHVSAAQRAFITERLDCGLQYLMSNQSPDGGWSVGERRRSFHHITALNAIALLRSHQPQAVRAAIRGVDWLNDYYRSDRDPSGEHANAVAPHASLSADAAATALVLEASVEAYRSTRSREYLYLPAQIAADLDRHDFRSGNWPCHPHDPIMFTARTIEMISDISGVISVQKDALLTARQGAEWLRSAQSTNGGWQTSISSEHGVLYVDVTPFVCYALGKVEQAELGTYDGTIRKGISHASTVLGQHSAYETLVSSSALGLPYLVYLHLVLNQPGLGMEPGGATHRETTLRWLEAALAGEEDPMVLSFLLCALLSEGQRDTFSQKP